MKTTVVAELSANHNGSLKRAVETIRQAKKAGADAVKLQTYTADTITLDCCRDDFLINGGTLWDGRTLHDLYEEAHTPWEWHKELFDVAQEEGLLCFSTPFDRSAVDFLEELGNPIYKIASFEANDPDLIKYAASKGKPLIVSAGIAAEEEIWDIVQLCNEAGVKLTLLKCASAYPAPVEETNLRMIPAMRTKFGVDVGLSDHSTGISLPIAAVALGAVMVEKHFTLDRSSGGADASFSLNPEEFSLMVTGVREAEAALGSVDFNLTEKQILERRFSRSLYVAEDIRKGEIVTEKKIRSVRPGYGAPPKLLTTLLEKRALVNMKKGDRVLPDLFSDDR